MRPPTVHMLCVTETASPYTRSTLRGQVGHDAGLPRMASPLEALMQARLMCPRRMHGRASGLASLATDRRGGEQGCAAQCEIGTSSRMAAVACMGACLRASCCCGMWPWSGWRAPCSFVAYLRSPSICTVASAGAPPAVHGNVGIGWGLSGILQGRADVILVVAVYVILMVQDAMTQDQCCRFAFDM